ncbi:ribonuclease G and E [Rhodobacter sphaeroides]|jgi:hypothetical protein|uniref:Uncharacterized protein n=1 Tax=Cereibacter sphaeroides (strain ATCC 17023 / DSM 158 / JCM 6121 / CCUG 31486 / LMG 2827 / NBRC 12203 / NCIMB 8253 / ATH 2.4.1.) TaxID=272943 RepID=Q3IV40_CERS4|nr:hypothetical protein [Cereibacter sphaeroides]ABA81594.1 hypothetical protein RSP_4119 [Cereibacter sphaeroides 2.4.1]AMJ50098.1 ribonuclease G and E [Cereibacter sphaeroides]ANS36719.1 ribonuclease G and E [Cereibacter sphaeroides]ATN65858.1 ribonuclease G and E [Cereibacter sphaeroides]AXC64022.1 ribonuclease G and E [Cereibacter sphaeroides 2.4.1]
MIYLGPVIVLLFFVILLLLLFTLATWSLRNSWYASAACLLITGLIATYLASLQSAAIDRRQRLLKSLAMPAGSPVIINPTTRLLEVVAQKRALIYIYDISDRKALPTRADAIQQNCRATNLRAALELGARIEHQYRAGTTEALRIIVQREDCF